MTDQITFSRRFVPSIPEAIEERILYISLPLSVAVHRCACGCGNESVTPIGENGWELFENGDLVTLEPSIGNWSFPCRSHYFIVDNIVVWAAAATQRMIDQSRIRDNPRAHQLPPIASRRRPWLRRAWERLIKFF